MGEFYYGEDDDLNYDMIEDVSNVKSISSSLLLGSTDWTADTIVSQVEKKNILLDPDFQRRDAWKAPRKSAFIESLILGFPIPQIVLAENKNKRGSFIVIDGKQRLLTLMQFFGKKGYSKLKLTNLKILTKCNNKTIDDIKKDLSLSHYIDNVENAAIRTVVIKNWDDESILYQIFLRLNTNTVSLSPQELRGALHPGPFVKFADEFSEKNKNIKKIFNIKKDPDFRMRDIELFIRFVGFKLFIEDYRGNLKKFLDDTCLILNKNWDTKESIVNEIADDFDIGVSTTYVIFGKNAYHKWIKNGYENKFNRAIFDIMMYYFSNRDISETAKQNKVLVKKCFESLCENNNEFMSSLERTTKSIAATKTRYTVWGNALYETLGIEIKIPVVTK
ncbi:MAG TPA: DUF262 domain-containing protein [Candidatus Mailhella merdigallinarum]|uniref:DUF262 domain-containing protein n=1 Tax=Candidatus Mailhella merdigallinarum TaxID=2838658 RepID=A0A9D2KMZ9_9BACT|nr:DUF262 domain-containing protein [Candidatus Mailhella merdigallinarum]